MEVCHKVCDIIIQQGIEKGTTIMPEENNKVLDGFVQSFIETSILKCSLHFSQSFNIATTGPRTPSAHI